MSELRDPMGLILAAARVDPVLMKAARQVDAELQAARAALDEIEALHEARNVARHSSLAFAELQCWLCSAEWPCPTMQIIAKAKGGTDE